MLMCLTACFLMTCKPAGAQIPQGSTISISSDGGPFKARWRPLSLPNGWQRHLLCSRRVHARFGKSAATLGIGHGDAPSIGGVYDGEVRMAVLTARKVRVFRDDSRQPHLLRERLRQSRSARSDDPRSCIWRAVFLSANYYSQRSVDRAGDDIASGARYM